MENNIKMDIKEAVCGSRFGGCVKSEKILSTG
jgi:hypothetical protein